MMSAQVAQATACEEAKETEPFIFPQGMAGFSADTRYGFVYEGRGDIVCMQSLDSVLAAFLMTPWDEERLGPPPALTLEQQTCLQLEKGEKPFWMLVLNPFVDEEWVVANMCAPVAINESGRRGVQCIQADPELDLRYRWIPQPKESV